MTDIQKKTDIQKNPQSEDFVLRVLQGYRAIRLAELEEKNSTRREKKHNVARLKANHLRQSCCGIGRSGLETSGDYVGLLPRDLSRLYAVELMIVLRTLDPFAPYELKVPDSDNDQVLCEVAEHLGLGRTFGEDLASAWASVSGSQSSLPINKILKSVAVGGLFFGLVGAVGAPFIAAGIGASAGLSGAAATSYGMAFLGGGSLASGGAGMLGGFLGVTSASLVGGAAMSGGLSRQRESRLWWNSLSPESAQVETLRLQLRVRLSMLPDPLRYPEVLQTIEDLAVWSSSLDLRIAVEQRLNESNATRIKDLEGLKNVVECARRWTIGELVQAEFGQSARQQ